MIFVQIQLKRDEIEGEHGNYFNYEFGIFDEKISNQDSIINFSKDILQRTFEKRNYYYVKNTEFKRIS